MPYASLLSASQLAEVREAVRNAPDPAAAYAALGQSLGASATGEPPESRGRAVIRRRLGELRGVLCADAALQDYCRDPQVADVTSVACAIAGALVAAHVGGINVVLVAALTARVGLRQFCEDAWRDPSSRS